MKLLRTHIFPFFLLAVFGFFLSVFFVESLFAVIGGFALMVYGTSKTVLHLTIDEHLRL